MITVVTAIKFQKSILDAINGITFLLDPSWTEGDNRNPTLPVAFIKVISQDEVFETQVTEKPMLLYNESVSESGDVINESAVTQVAADNILNKPRQWKLKCLVPSTSILGDNLITSTGPEQIAAVNGFLSKEDTSRPKLLSDTTMLSSIISYVMQGLSTASLITQKVIELIKQPASAKPQNFLTIPNYNKNSLIQMWKNRSILKMKLWDSWEYKYVAITNMNIHKEGRDQKVQEAEITVQEVPMIVFGASFTKVALSEVTKLDKWSPVNVAGNFLKKALSALEI